MKRIVEIEVSARHVHLCQSDLNILYGDGYELTPDKWLSQPGQFVSKERIKVVGPKKTFENVAILGPVRKISQVEFALTDCYSLGILAPVRESGDINDTPAVSIATDLNTVDLNNGLIIAKRHIHITPEEAKAFGVIDKQIVSVKVTTDRKLIFDDVIVRISPEFRLYMHIDTDEANAANIRKDKVFGEIIVKGNFIQTR